MKYLCQKCNTIAVWNYAPGKGDRFYCEGHVPRGCSCNDNEDGSTPLDEKGREFPCCEYDYNEKGFVVHTE